MLKTELQIIELEKVEASELEIEDPEDADEIIKKAKNEDTSKHDRGTGDRDSEQSSQGDV